MIIKDLIECEFNSVCYMGCFFFKNRRKSTDSYIFISARPLKIVPFGNHRVHRSTAALPAIQFVIFVQM